jgi:hypothetical protein
VAEVLAFQAVKVACQAKAQEVAQTEATHLVRMQHPIQVREEEAPAQRQEISPGLEETAEVD